MILVFLLSVASAGELEPGPVPAQGTTVTLIDAGAQPRQERRYTAIRGVNSRSRIVTLHAVRFQEEGGQTRNGSDPSAACLTVHAGSVSASGDVDVQVDASVLTAQAFLDNPVDPCQVKGLQSAGVAQLVVSPTGAVGPVTWSGDGRLSVDMETLITPLPQQAIGVGARWRSTRRSPSRAVNAVEVVEWRLVAAQGDTLQITGRVRLLPSTTETPLPLIQTDEAVSVDSWQEDGEDARTVQLSALIPSQITRAQGGSVAVTIGEGAASRHLHMDNHTDITVDAAPTD